MKALWAQYAARFDALSLRERLLVCAACGAVVGLLLFTLLLDPIVRERTQLRGRIDQQQQVLVATRAAVQSLRSGQAHPDATARVRRENLVSELAGFDRELERVARGLVVPERMVALLEQLIGRESRLQVIALRSLAPSPLVAPSGSRDDKTPSPETVAREAAAERSGPAAGRGKDASGIFKHGIELTVQGSYADLSTYVTRLERMPWRMFWARAVLDAAQYPQVSLTLTLYTLSLERSWLRL